MTNDRGRGYRSALVIYALALGACAGLSQCPQPTCPDGKPPFATLIVNGSSITSDARQSQPAAIVAPGDPLQVGLLASDTCNMKQLAIDYYYYPVNNGVLGVPQHVSVAPVPLACANQLEKQTVTIQAAREQDRLYSFTALAADCDENAAVDTPPLFICQSLTGCPPAPTCLAVPLHDGAPPAARLAVGASVANSGGPPVSITLPSGTTPALEYGGTDDQAVKSLALSDTKCINNSDGTVTCSQSLIVPEDFSYCPQASRAKTFALGGVPQQTDAFVLAVTDFAGHSATVKLDVAWQ